MAQTAGLASFGPVLLISIHSHTPCTFKTHIEPKYNGKYWLVYKKREGK